MRIDTKLLNYVKRAKYPIDSKDAKKLANDICQLLREGASIPRSCALIAAVERECFPLVVYLHTKDPSATNSADHNGITPLMMCGIKAGERALFPCLDNKILNYLLESRARKNLQDKNDLPAYGHYVSKCIEIESRYNAAIGHSIPTAVSPANYESSTPAGRLIEAKLFPPDGPTASDIRGVQRPPTIMTYHDVAIASENEWSDDDCSSCSSDCSSGDFPPSGEEDDPYKRRGAVQK